MKRVEAWPVLLSEFIEERRSTPLQWGVHDCCLFSADWILLCTGVDFAKEVRGTYSTEFGAKRLLAEFAAENPTALADQRLSSISPRLAKRGDIISIKIDGAYSMGICTGSRGAFVGFDGLVFMPLKQAELAWSV